MERLGLIHEIELEVLSVQELERWTPVKNPNWTETISSTR